MPVKEGIPAMEGVPRGEDLSRPGRDEESTPTDQNVEISRPDRIQEKVRRALEEVAEEAPGPRPGEETLPREDKLAVSPFNTVDSEIEPMLREPSTSPGSGEPGLESQEDLPEVVTHEETTPVEIVEQEDIPVIEPVEIVEGTAARDPRWVIGAALSPLYSFRDAESDAMAGAADFESGLVAYAGGVQVSYRAAGRLSIESGIFYNKMGISIGAPGIQLFNSSVDFSPLASVAQRSNMVVVANSVGNIVSKSGDIFVNNYKVNAASESNSFADYGSSEVYTAEEGIMQHLDYLELPFNMRYSVIDRTFELQLVGGLSTNFLVNNYVTMDTPDGPEEIGYLANVRNVNYSGNAGIGMIYHIHKQFSITVEPRFRYFLHSVNDATLPSTRPYSLGLYTGLSYTF
jgi:hypothetical protein